MPGIPLVESPKQSGIFYVILKREDYATGKLDSRPHDERRRRAGGYSEKSFG
jgi:hypothetical protein